MPDLGKYAGTVLSGYAVAIILIVALLAVTLWNSARVRRALKAQEDRMDRRG